MPDLAREAGVAVKTVYASVGTKQGVLEQLLAAGLSESNAWATIERSREATDLPTVIRAVAQAVRADTERFTPIISILQSARGSEPAAGRAWDQMIAAYRGALRVIATDLVDRHLADPELDVAAVTDRLWFCFGPSAWQSLITESGWNHGRAEEWLARQAVSMLTAP